MTLTRIGAANKPNTGTSDITLGIIVNPTIIAVNIKMLTTLIAAQHRHAEDDPLYFMDDTFKTLRAMGAHGPEAVEFFMYQLKDVTHDWFELWVSECSTTTFAPAWTELERAFMKRFLFEEARFALATKFEQLE
ncbi:hypothetical protein HAX54_016630 [Datura stramonium]|uniref:Retrotransposon gag domain-containing protein n=1 Tax=Datura stramonium TaxID=4076 RepID=A0ABS8UKF3_DATST|nr:hypothetical protein [Datura stramonium]